MHVRLAARCHVGRVRARNEDAYLLADLGSSKTLDGAASSRCDVSSAGVLLAVSDGMGGADAGDVASSTVIATLESAARAGARREEDRDPVRLLRRAVESANRAVWEASCAAGQTGRRRMGATLTAALVRDGRLYVAQVGDSRAYLLRSGTITPVTEDQSLVRSLVKGGLMTEHDASCSPLRNVILQAMGQRDHLDIALSAVSLRDRDGLLLCSDGLTSHVADEEIRDIVATSLRLDVAASRLVDLANDRGGRDNITVILAGFGGGLPSLSAGERVPAPVEVITRFAGEIT